MKKLLLTLPLLAIPLSSNVTAAIDPTAQEVNLLNSCTDVNAMTIDNCFETSSDLTDWLKNTRKPNATNPISVKISVGEFGQLKLRCDASTGYTGHISFQGSGRTLSVFSSNSGYTVTSGSCTDLEFSNLKIVSVPSSGGAISWTSGGNSTWSNVDVRSVYYGWKEASDCGANPTRGLHTWTGSTIINDSFGKAEAYVATCDESWFYGSQIVQKLGPLSVNSVTTISASGAGEIHLYGSNIGALSEETTIPSTFVAVFATNGGKIHIHGTGIDVISTAPFNITALYASNGGSIHANQSAYVLTTGTGGSITRIKNNGGVIKAPYDWEQSTAAPNVISVTGADTYVETDCNSSGLCTGVPTLEQQPHGMIYSENCSNNGPWFDTTMNACRQ